MAALVFGEDIVCPECDGTGDAPLNDEDKRERSRVLRMAHRRKEEPPPLVHRPCPECSGVGIQRAKGKYR